MKDGFLGFEDDEAFWRAPLARQDVALARLIGRKVTTLALDAPTEVELPLRDTLPAVVGLVATYQELHGLDLGAACALVAVNVDTSEVVAANVEATDGFAEPASPGPAPAVKGKGALLLLACARARTGLAWAPGSSYLLSALLRDLTSRRVPVKLKAGPSTFVDPAALELIDERRRAFALRPRVAGGLDASDAAAAALVPKRPGLALSADRVVVLEPGARAVLRVGLRTSLRPWERVTRAPWVDDDATITGVVPVTLVVCGAQRADPIVIPLRVPVRVDVPDDLLETPAADGPEVTVSFALDLRRLEGFSPRPGTSFVSVYSGRHAAGPAPIALISPMALRGL